jgi:hypothetical protein
MAGYEGAGLSCAAAVQSPRRKNIGKRVIIFIKALPIRLQSSYAHASVRPGSAESETV